MVKCFIIIPSTWGKALPGMGLLVPDTEKTGVVDLRAFLRY
jgi:hypothetical protein